TSSNPPKRPRPRAAHERAARAELRRATWPWARANRRVPERARPEPALVPGAARWPALPARAKGPRAAEPGMLERVRTVQRPELGPTEPGLGESVRPCRSRKPRAAAGVGLPPSTALGPTPPHR